MRRFFTTIMLGVGAIFSIVALIGMLGVLGVLTTVFVVAADTYQAMPK